MFILIKFPSRGRPDQLKSTLQGYISYAVDMTNIFIMVTLDSDDPTTTLELVNSLLVMHPNIRVDVGISGTKIKAINRDMDKAPRFDILLLASDDMIPVIHGYDNIIRHAMHKYYPTTDGVLWFNDGYQGNGLNTLPIMGRKYYQRFGYIYNPIYKTLWCDKEFTDISVFLGRQIYSPQVIIEHRHCTNGKAEVDETYIKNSDIEGVDTTTYKSRRAINYGMGIGFSIPRIKVKIYR